MNKKQKVVVGIIGGTGLLGKIFSDVFKRNNCDVLIAGRKTKLSYKDLVKKSDVVIFSVPINVVEKVIEDVLPYTRKDQLLMDFTSIKEPSVNAMLKSEASVIGLHPMFGPVESLKGKTIIACPKRPGDWLSWVKEIFKKEGAKLKIITAKKHDKIMALLQGLMHSNFIIFGKTLGKTLEKFGINFDDLLDYGGSIYRMRYNVLARILNHDPKLYADIAIENNQVKKVIQTYKQEAEKFQEIIDSKDKENFERYFKEAGESYGDFKKEVPEESKKLIEYFSKINKAKKEK